MVDVYPVDFSSNVGRIRKYIPDLIQVEDPANPTDEPAYMWSDAAIESFLLDELPIDWEFARAPRSAIWRASAAIMIATANNENLVLKKLVTEDLQTDGPSVAKALLLAAAELRKRADAEDLDDVETFLIVPNPTESSYGIEGVFPSRPWSV